MGTYNEAYRDEFEANIKYELQQMETMLTMCCTPGTIEAEYLYTDFLDAFTATSVTTTNADTVNTEPTFERRRVGLSRYTIAPLLDKATMIKMTGSNTMTSVRQGAVAGLYRAMDSVVYTALDADVQTGRVGAGTTSYDATMTVSGTSGLTTTVLIDTKNKIDNNAVGFYGSDELYFVCTPTQIADLLTDTKATSADYNSIKALVNGEINSFMGFKFVSAPAAIVTASGGIRKCFGFSKRGMFWGVGEDVTVDIAPRRDKNNSIQIFVEFLAGAVRHYEGLVSAVMLTES